MCQSRITYVVQSIIAYNHPTQNFASHHRSSKVLLLVMKWSFVHVIWSLLSCQGFSHHNNSHQESILSYQNIYHYYQTTNHRLDISMPISSNTQDFKFIPNDLSSAYICHFATLVTLNYPKQCLNIISLYVIILLWHTSLIQSQSSISMSSKYSSIQSLWRK